ncbi:MAG: LTA synthase family protein [Methyloglobulus sp.]|nr:LTA synthase family protein [Methyloglobulus sp.]
MSTKLIPLISTALFYLAFNLIGALKFDVMIKAQAITIGFISNIALDFMVNLAVAYVLSALSRRVSIFLVLQALIMGVLYIGNAIKISFFGGPIMPDDVFALRSMLLILEGWQFVAAALTVAGIASLFLFNLTMRHWSAYLAMLAAIMLGLTVVYKPAMLVEPLDKYTGSSVWDQRSNYLWHGGMLYSLQEGSRYFLMAEAPPDVDNAQQSAERLIATQPAQPKVGDKAFAPRNIHIILLESFWDPNRLKKAGYNKNPLAPEFRKLWKSVDYSTAIPPVFGGYTANSEFEVLCGFPVVRNSVKFERQLLNSTPCLPHILADKGYRTVVSHPNVPVFWNRVNAYHYIGFQTYWSIKDFVQDDMNREFMSDATLYRQVIEKITPSLEKKEPVLDYIVTIFGHWNYPLSASRPSKITSRSKVEEVSTYANMAYYKSLELMGFINEMRKKDPDGIIVAFGDHLPFMGGNYAGYVDSGVLAAHNTEFTPEMLKFYVTTPMIIIDGKNGPVKFGSLPLYQVPKLLLNLLNNNEPTIMDYAHSLPDMRVRPLPGLHFNVLKDGKIDVCKEPPYSESCQKSTSWLDDVITVSNDLFIGQQFTRIKHPVAKDLNNVLPEQAVVLEVVTTPADKKTEKDKQKPDTKKKH